MITNRDIEIAFARAQARINDNLEDAQIQFMSSDIERLTELLTMQNKRGKPKQNMNNPISNEEI